jgi:hypothetical protein
MCHCQHSEFDEGRMSSKTAKKYKGLFVFFRYIHVYGRKFTKEQHIQLINLYVELLTMKTCPLNIISCVAEMLNTLLR